MKPITRKEFYLAKAAGTYTGPTPPPVLREDYYLATLAGDYSGNCPAPVTRLDMFMSAAAGLTSYVPQPITRLEMYWYNIAKGTGYVPEPATREEQLLYAIIHKEPQYIDKTAEGSTILLTDSAEASFTALTIYGHSTQDGTPSPENPVPIVGAGSVMTTGAQLLDIPNYSGISDGVSWNIKDGKIIADGTAVDNYSYSPFYELNLTPGTYYISPISQGAEFYVRITKDSQNQYYIDNTFDIDGTEDAVVAYAAVNPGITVNNVTIYPMLNAGDTALPWEPYTGGVPGVNPYEGEINVSISDGNAQSQTLPISTPGGLPGIPVTSGGNYTDENGQQWICDEIDLKRGKYVQRVGKIVVDGVNLRFSASVDGVYWNLPNHSAVGVAHQEVMSTYFPLGFFGANIPDEFIYTVLDRAALYFSSVDELNEFVAQKNTEGTPLELYYAMNTPIETDLTAEEIAAFQALHTYSPTTTVMNDADAWMKVGYKSPQNVGRIYKRNR